LEFDAGGECDPDYVTWERPTNVIEQTSVASYVQSGASILASVGLTMVKTAVHTQEWIDISVNWYLGYLMTSF
jgi:hypothetical protein